MRKGDRKMPCLNGHMGFVHENDLICTYCMNRRKQWYKLGYTYKEIKEMEFEELMKNDR